MRSETLRTPRRVGGLTLSLVLAVLAGCGGPVSESELQPVAERQDELTMPKGRVLVVVSSATVLPLRPLADGTPRSIPTGYFLNELGATLRVLEESGYAIDIATPGGLVPTIDVNGLEKYHYTLQAGINALAARDADIQVAWRHFGKLKLSTNTTISTEVRDYLARVQAAQVNLVPRQPLRLEALTTDAALAPYAGVYVPGGHAPKVDLLYSPAMGAVLRHFHAFRKPTALICHAPIVMLSAFPRPWSHTLALTDTDKRAFIYAGYRITVGNVSEERMLEDSLYLSTTGDKLPYYVEPELREAGFYVNTFRVTGTSQIEQDRELLTGGNPASTPALAEAFRYALDTYVRLAALQ
jgi:putative intracellular protease/amidase